MNKLDDIARRFHTPALEAMVAEARGTVSLATDHAEVALEPLGAARTFWDRSDAPYLAARVRLRLGLASRALGDEEGARLEWEAARAAFERLGAAPDVTRIDALLRSSRIRTGTLTRREREVLKLVATGETNRAIAARLGLSDRTIERHLSNIFTKLDVPSRAAATAYAVRHGLD